MTPVIPCRHALWPIHESTQSLWHKKAQSYQALHEPVHAVCYSQRCRHFLLKQLRLQAFSAIQLAVVTSLRNLKASCHSLRRHTYEVQEKNVIKNTGTKRKNFHLCSHDLQGNLPCQKQSRSCFLAGNRAAACHC